MDYLDNPRTALRWVLALGAALAFGAALAGPADTAPASGVPRPVFDVPQGAKCVADPAFMRRNHMNLLLHQRDETVREGVRGKEFSLSGCIECHANGKTGSVIGSDRNFCQSCHSYAAVKLDCFECHASKAVAASGATRGVVAGAAP